jgi:hypothetical protein
MGKQTGTLVALVFVARDLTHRQHLRTMSYAEHVALGAFYKKVIPLVDEFVEAYQGRFNDLLEITLGDNDFEGEIADILEQQMAWIEDNRESICPKAETALNNSLDEIVTLYQRTLYKLRFLS